MKLTKNSNKFKKKYNKKRKSMQKYRYNKSSNIGGADVVETALLPWNLDIVRTLILGNYDPKSSLNQLSGFILYNIIQNWAWSEILVNSARLWNRGKLTEILINQMSKVNPGVSEKKLWQNLTLNKHGVICNWDLSKCNLIELPELFGAIRTTEYLDLSGNQVKSLPESFGYITVGMHLDLSDNQLNSLPDSFKSITVGQDLLLYRNPLQDQVIPTVFPNVVGDVKYIL